MRRPSARRRRRRAAPFQVFAQQLQRHGRRQITLGRAGRLGLTRDEQLLLAVFTAARDADQSRCEAHLRWLLARPSEPAFYACARLAAILLMRGERTPSYGVPAFAERATTA